MPKPAPAVLSKCARAFPTHSLVVDVDDEVVDAVVRVVVVMVVVVPVVVVVVVVVAVVVVLVDVVAVVVVLVVVVAVVVVLVVVVVVVVWQNSLLSYAYHLMFGFKVSVLATVASSHAPPSGLYKKATHPPPAPRQARAQDSTVISWSCSPMREYRA